MTMTRVIRSGLATLAFIAVGPGAAFSQTACTASGLASGTSYAVLTDANIKKTLNTAMACYPTVGPFTNQEFHALASNGTVTEYAQGTSAVDPTHVVGSWSVTKINGTYGTLAYTYTSQTGTYVYTVWGDSSLSGTGTNVFDLCPVGGGAALAVRVVQGVTKATAC